MIPALIPFLKFIILSGISIIVLVIVYLCIKALPFRPQLNSFPSLNFFRTFLTGNRYRRTVMKHRERIHKKWERIISSVKSNDERDLRLAIIEADSLIDEILKEHGHPGHDMGERLQSIHSAEFRSLDALWGAHKIRNRLVHEAGYKIPREEARRIIAVYHKCMEDLLDMELEMI